jgi:hypothetical protein
MGVRGGGMSLRVRGVDEEGVGLVRLGVIKLLLLLLLLLLCRGVECDCELNPLLNRRDVSLCRGVE